MKTIKIFLASSEELKEERKELADIVANLNHILSKQGVFVDLVKWEYLDASMGAAHKQEDYNAELRDCEMCIVLYWTRFGMYTKTELETAYTELKGGRNPRKLYVYFKESDDISEDLRTFRDSFPTVYGHFFSNFSNIDTLKAHFLLQFMEYMSKYLQGSDVVVIKNSQVSVNGQTFVNLTNVPFAGNNEEYNLLLKNIKKTKKLLSISEPEDPEYSEYAQELQELEKKLAQMENSLWDTALMVTRLSSTKQSERLQRAMDLFNGGDNKGAMAVLKEEDIDRDVQHNLHLIELGEEGKKGLKTNIEEYTLRIKTFKNDMAEGWGEEVLSLHRKVLELAGKVYGEESLQVAKYQVAATFDFSGLGKHQEALEIGTKALNSRIKYLGDNHPDVAQCYNIIGHEYLLLGNRTKALLYAERELDLRMSLCDEDDPMVAFSYGNVGSMYGELGNHKKALECCEKSLTVLLSIYGENHPLVAWSLVNVGNVYSALGDYPKAIENMEKALLIRIRMGAGQSPEVAQQYNDIGAEYGKASDLQKEIEYRIKGLEIAQSIKDTSLEATLHNRVGITYQKMGDMEQARNHFKLAAEKFKELGDEEECKANMDIYNSLLS